MIEKTWLLKKLEKAPKFLSHLYALFFINFGWVIFAYDKWGALKSAVKNMFGFGGLTVFNRYTAYMLLSYGLFLIIAFVAATPYPRLLAGKFITKIEDKKSSIAGVVEGVFIICVMLLSTAFLASEAFNPFLYFRF